MNKLHFISIGNKVLSIFWLAAISLSIIGIVFAAAPNPGHDFTAVSGGVAQGDLMYGSAADTLSTLAKNITATRYLSNTGASNNPAWAQIDLTNGVTGALPTGNGGTNITTYATGDILYGSAANVLSKLAGAAGFLKSTGAAAPTWSAVSLTADVNGILPTANGGTGIAYFTAAGPTVARTYTFPDAAATVLTTNAPVTVAQGGTGLATLTTGNVILGAGTGNVTFVAPGTSGNVLTSNGSTWTSTTAAGGNDPRIITKALSANQTISSATMAKVTNLDQTAGVGTWVFQYYVLYRSDTATVGVKLGVNHSGTVTTFVTEATGVEATTAASTGAADQVHAAFGLRSGGSSRAKSTSAAIYGSTSVDTVNADMLAIINGIMVVTVSGNLELYFGSETTGTGVQTIMKDSSLVLTKIQ